jgi:outer membrane protein TolC
MRIFVLFLALIGGTAAAQEIPAEEEAALAAGLASAPDGYSADAVASRAAQTSYQAQVNDAALRGAAARVGTAWTAFFPRLGGTVSYTRDSDFTAKSLGTFVTTNDAPGPITNISAKPPTLIGVPFALPPVVNNWFVQATLSVPVSDYFLRITESYTAAVRGRDAAGFDLGAARMRSAADGRLAYYDWLRAQGALVVARLALADQRTHLHDTRTLFEVGGASQVDVLRVETAVSAAELVVVQSENLVDVSARQLRVALHVDDQAGLASSERIDGARPAPISERVAALIAEAQTRRYEVRSLDANAAAAGAQAKAALATAMPVLSAFASAEYANPNERVFPETNTWSGTWEAGVRLSFSPNDIGFGVTQSDDARSRARNLVAQRQLLRDGIAVEVTQAYDAVREADFSLGSTGQQLTSAREAVRVARELFLAGRVTSTTLTDAETELTRARLAVLNARIDARTTRVRLEHALGRDQRFAAR